MEHPVNEIISWFLHFSITFRPCSSCELITAINNTSETPQLPQFIILGLQKWSSIVIKIYSTYQAEVTGVICVLKYYKLLNLPDSLTGLWELVNNYLNINLPSSSARTFFPFPEIDFEDKQQISQETLSRCAQVYLFSFFVRALEDLI